MDPWELESLESTLEIEKNNLFYRVQKNFWVNLILKLLEKNTKAFSFEREYYRWGYDSDYSKVIGYLTGVMNDIAHIYGIEGSVGGSSVTTEILFKFHVYDKENYQLDELSLTITEENITIKYLPCSYATVLSLEDWKIVGNFLLDLCDFLYKTHHKKYAELWNYFEKLNTYAKGLSSKEIEIAQNSIKAIYDSYIPKEDRRINQKYLFTLLRVDEKDVVILHGDILKNPDNLLKLFKQDITK